MKSQNRRDWVSRCFMGLKTFLQAEKVCQESANIVTKIIRVKYLADILPLLEEGIKIVHLIRDPRGILTSRLLTMGEPNLRRYKLKLRGFLISKGMHTSIVKKLKTNRDYFLNVTR